MPHTAVLSGHALDGRYELHDVIGEGTFGRVYRGRDQRLARPVAVKVIKPWWTEDPDWARSFEREAQLMARVNDPGIVQIFDIGYADEGLYYVAELVDGESLAARLRHGPLSPATAREVAEQLCRALAHAHAQRVVHRDVKPANVLISADGRVKVGDFGIARLAEGTTDGAAGTIVGTPRYMAPEQARGRPTSPATDVYGAGIVLYEMLAGRPPFTERSAVELALRHLSDPPPPLPADTPEVLAAIVERALAKDPAARYPSAREMADALAEARAVVSDQDAAGRQPLPAVARAGRASGLDDPELLGQRPEDLAAASVETPEDLAAASVERPEDLPATSMGTPEELPATSAETRRDAPAATRVASRRAPRRNMNPAEGRRYRALLVLVVLLLLGLATGAVLTSSSKVRVPAVSGLTRSGVVARLRVLHLRAAFGQRYDSAPRGTAIAQQPAAGTRVQTGATMRVILSKGPAPIAVPQLVGQTSTDAQATLQRLGLGAGVTAVPAPGVSPSTVVRQSPGANADLAPHSTVGLFVAETPRWRPLTSFSGSGSGQSVPFQIRGSHWQVVYSMAYDGTCTLIFFCSGPSAQITNLNSGATVSQFDLSEGTGQTHVFKSGPGLYQVTVTPGSDTASWSVHIEDYY